MGLLQLSIRLNIALIIISLLEYLSVHPEQSKMCRGNHVNMENANLNDRRSAQGHNSMDGVAFVFTIENQSERIQIGESKLSNLIDSLMNTNANTNSLLFRIVYCFR